MRLVSWPSILSILAIAGGTPVLWSFGLSPSTVFFAVVSAVAFIVIVAHVVGSWRVGHAI